MAQLLEEQPHLEVAQVVAMAVLAEFFCVEQVVGDYRHELRRLQCRPDQDNNSCTKVKGFRPQLRQGNRRDNDIDFLSRTAHAVRASLWDAM